VTTEIRSESEFASFANTMRAELHRYCARITGSVFDGEDIVQETIMRVLQTPSRPTLPKALRAYIFRTAHNAAIDLSRSKLLRDPVAQHENDEVADPARDPFEELARKQALTLAIAQYLQLPQPQRSIVILKDVLNESISDISVTLGLSVQSIKAHLHRGRLRMMKLGQPPKESIRPASANAATQSYVDCFNSRNWSGLRAMLAEDVVLHQTSVAVVRGKGNVGENFFSRYSSLDDWKMSIAFVEGREVVWVIDMSEGKPEDYFMVLNWRDGTLSSITDFRHARYIARNATPKSFLV
jgi:RNA polymerase sigma factor (sigma-70 family)